MNKTNWRPIVYTCLLIATKFWDDKYFWNIDVVRKLKLFNLHYTNKYENIIIAINQFDLTVEKTTFDSYFNWLRVYKYYIDNSEDVLLSTTGE